MIGLILAILLSAGSLQDSAVGLQISLEDEPQTWQPLTDSTVIPFGGSCWIRTRIPSISTKDQILTVGNWYMNGMTFYDSDMKPIGQGNTLDIEGRSGQLIFIQFPYIDEKTGIIDINIIQKVAYLQTVNRKNTLQIGFQSIFLFVSVVLILLALRSHDRLYWYFFIYVASTAYFFAYQYGLLGAVFPALNRISPTWWWISSASISLSYAFFAQAFLDLKEKDLTAYNLFEFGKYFILLVVIAEVVAHACGYDLQHQLAYKVLVISVEVPLMFYIMFRIFRLGDILSRIFLLGMLILALSSLSGQFLSTLRLTVESNYLIQLGMLVDILIFSVGVSVRIGLVYKARENAQKTLIDQLQLNEEFQHKYTQELEETVKRRTSELAQRNEENELLLREVHHRVKNNLQMVSSLLNMQRRRTKDESIKEVFNFTQSRVQSIGLVHEHLYQQNNFSRLNLQAYVRDLVGMLMGSSISDSTPKLKIEVDEMWAEIDTAIPIGLMLNELITNAMKYAIPTVGEPILEIILREDKDGLILSVNDNGTESPDFKMGFGWTIIQSTLQSMSGDYEISQDGGMKIALLMRDYKISHSNR